MNILILAAGMAEFNAHDANYPLCLTELDGVPLIQRLMQSCVGLGDIRFIIALREADVRNFHLDNIVSLLAPTAKILSIKDGTRGAACTALLAVEYIDSAQELLILNGNEILDIDFSKVIMNFRERALDAGIVTFSSVHPRYSYVRLNAQNLVTQAAEKNPISRNAIGGFYWFARGGDFVYAAKNMIRKDACLHNRFYISPALNELILKKACIGIFPIDTNKYHPLKTERQLMQFEATFEHRKD